MIRPLVSVITINYNQLQVTCALLDSLQKISYPNYEVIVVDNASRENPQSTLQKLFPAVKVVISKDNLGFAAGNNEGVKLARGEYILFLNNDIEVEPDFLEPLVELLENDPQTGIVTPKIRFFHNPEIIQYAGSTPMNFYKVASYALGYGVADQGQFAESHETHLPHGAAMLVPKKIIEKVGVMAEQFFLYYEELDWCIRIKKAGYKVYYEAKSLVFHKESMSVGKASRLQIYYKTRNRILFVRRNTKGIQKCLALLYLGFIAPSYHLLRYTFTETKLVKVYIKALLWHLKSFKHIHYNPSVHDTQRYIFKEENI